MASVNRCGQIPLPLKRDRNDMLFLGLRGSDLMSNIVMIIDEVNKKTSG